MRRWNAYILLIQFKDRKKIKSFLDPYFSEMKKKKDPYCLNQKVANYGPWAKPDLLLDYVNKGLLEHSHSHFFFLISAFTLQKQN